MNTNDKDNTKPATAEQRYHAAYEVGIYSGTAAKIVLPRYPDRAAA